MARRISVIKTVFGEHSGNLGTIKAVVSHVFAEKR